jgi:gluconolactonase
MDKTIDVIAEGLGHPEGPCLLPDGRVVFANSYLSELRVWNPSGETSSYAFTGGGPNACVLGSDGCLYVANTPTVGRWMPQVPIPACIQRVSSGVQTEIIVTKADGHTLNAPNDLTFGPDGRIYFTDSGDWDPINKPHLGYICVIDRDGTSHVLEELDAVYPNGIVAEPDGSIVWVESYTRRVVRRAPNGRKAVLHTLPENHIPDGLKIDVNGNFWIAGFSAGGVDVLQSDGAPLDFLKTGGVPLNCVFVGTKLLICDFGTTDNTETATMGGRLLMADVGVAGMKVFQGSVA